MILLCFKVIAVILSRNPSPIVITKIGILKIAPGVLVRAGMRLIAKARKQQQLWKTSRQEFGKAKLIVKFTKNCINPMSQFRHI